MGAWAALAALVSVVACGARCETQLRCEVVTSDCFMRTPPRVEVIDAKSKKNNIVKRSDFSDLGRCEQSSENRRIVADTRPLESSASRKDRIDLAGGPAWVHLEIRRTVLVEYSELNPGSCFQCRASSNIGKGDAYFIVLRCYGLNIAGRQRDCDPRPIGSQARTGGDVIGLTGNIKRLEDSRRLSLSGRGEAVSSPARGHGCVGLAPYSAGLRPGGIGACLNSAQLPRAVFREIACRGGLRFASGPELVHGGGLNFSGKRLRLTGSPEIFHSLRFQRGGARLGLAGGSNAAHLVGLLRGSAGEILRVAGERMGIDPASAHLMPLGDGSARDHDGEGRHDRFWPAQGSPYRPLYALIFYAAGFGAMCACYTCALISVAGRGIRRRLPLLLAAPFLFAIAFNLIGHAVALGR